jgi:hypothetical protein
MAWSPIRRANAGSFEVAQPGDYATLNSNQLRDGTCFGRFWFLRTSADSNLEAANLVDTTDNMARALWAIAKALHRIANAMDSDGRVDAGGG